jgi:hypothetical protein
MLLDHSKMLNWARVIGLLCMEIMGNHGCLKPNSSFVLLNVYYPKSRSQVLI